MNQEIEPLMSIGIKNGAKITLAEIEKIPASLPCLMGWKDCSSRYLGLSDYLIQFSGLESREKILGKNDQEIKRYEIVADYFMSCDQYAMKIKPYHSLENIVSADDQLIPILATKYPIFDGSHAKVVGVFFFGALANLLPQALKESASSLTVRLSSSHYVFERANGKIELTQKESRVLYFYLRGRSAKEIAWALSSSPRTVEDYLYAIKGKLQINSRSGITDFVIHSGLFDFIPSSLLLSTDKNLAR